MTLQANQITLTAPKPRAILSKTIRILRTDSSTVKCWLPKTAYIIGVHVVQTSNAATAAGSRTAATVAPAPCATAVSAAAAAVGTSGSSGICRCRVEACVELVGRQAPAAARGLARVPVERRGNRRKLGRQARQHAHHAHGIVQR